MTAKASASRLTDDLENDIALAMLIERRLSGKIGSSQARDLIEKVKIALSDTRSGLPHAHAEQDLIEGFPVH